MHYFQFDNYNILLIYYRTMDFRSTQPPTEVSTRDIFWEVKKAGA